MSQPLGDAVGNALDVAEAVDLLSGRLHGRLRELAVAFAARAAAHADDRPLAEAEAAAERALDDGSALERFGAMIERQGGDRRVVDDPWAVLPRAPVVLPLLADRDGVVASIEAEAIGLASVALGAGRLRKGDPIDPAVGIVLHAKLGDRLSEGEPIGEVHARDDAGAEEASRRVLAAVGTGERAAPPPLVHAWFGEGT
jgi:pyrimidine-nucleoside phosphorylase